MLTTDDFTIIVPTDGSPFLVEAGYDLSPYVGSESYIRLNKIVALKDGRSVHGSVFRGRKTGASEELAIMDLLNSRFVKN